MSYDPTVAVPAQVTEGGLAGDLPKLWFYSSADTPSGNYFSDGYTRGMRAGDYVMATDTGVGQVLFFRVTAVQSPPNPQQPNSTRYVTLSTGIQIGH